MPLLFDAENRPITTLEGWVRHRVELRKAWLAFLGTIPDRRPSDNLEVLEEDRPDGVIRECVSYQSEPGLRVEAYLLRPAKPGRGRPGAVVLHSTVDWTIRQPAGLEGPEELHIGLHLARRGYVAFCPRNFLWDYRQGANPNTAVEWLRKRHPMVTGMAKMIFDARRAVDVLSGQPDVDPRRIGAIGHSLGARKFFTSPRSTSGSCAAVSSEGGIGLHFSNWEAPWYLGDAI